MQVANTLPKKKKKKPEDDEGGGLRSLVEVEDKKPPRDEKLEALLCAAEQETAGERGLHWTQVQLTAPKNIRYETRTRLNTGKSG